VVNQLQPVHDCEHCNHQNIRQVQALKTAFTSVFDSIFWGLPMAAAEPRGPLLYDLWQSVYMVDFDAKESTHSEKEHKPPFVVITPLEPPAETLRVILFAGKGGVGKTTTACATALRVHHDHSEKRVLLFSTDPAHSLSDCLCMPINSIPTKVVDNLDAQEINAEANFASIRHKFSEELDTFLKQALQNLDLTFDREVMEHLLDLAPPGLDEIMALTEIMDHIDHGIYDVIVVDAAPIGHLLRLLEMPELIRDWLKLFFNLLLKYRDVMRLPYLSGRLVALSRGLKGLQSLLQDPEKTGVYVVTIPTELAIDKTIGMVSSLQQVGVQLQGLLMNQITPINTCDFCQSKSSREATQIERARNIFSDQPQAGIYKHINPSGITMLASLGNSLYQKTIAV
jgi:arsenite-transporting ATPase